MWADMAMISSNHRDFSAGGLHHCESTYGDKLHEPSELTGKKLLDIIIDTCLKKRAI